MNELEEKRLMDLARQAVSYKVTQEAQKNALNEVLAHPEVAKTTVLHFLASIGGSDVRRAALSHPDVANAHDDAGNTPLHGAGVEWISHPGFTTTRNNQGATPLHGLAAYGFREALSHPLVASVRDDNGNTPLHWMAHQGKELVLEHPEASTVTNFDGETPAQLYKHVTEVSRQLADLDDYEEEKRNHQEDHGDFAIKDRAKRMSSLMARAAEGDESVLEDPDVTKVQDINRMTPLHYLAKKGSLAVLKHPDIANTQFGSSALHVLAGQGKVEVLAHPDVATAKEEGTGRTPLHNIAMRGLTEVLSHPMVARVKDRWGNTPLHELAKTGLVAVYEHPESTMVQNNRDETPALILLGAGVRRPFITSIKHAANVFRQALGDQSKSRGRSY